MGYRARKRRERERAIAELRKSQRNLSEAEQELQRRLNMHLDTIDRKAAMERILDENHIADLMFEALSERRRK